MANFVDFNPLRNSFRERSTEREPHTTHAARGLLAARSAAAGCGLGPKMARQFEVRHCLSPPTSEIHKICTCSDRGPYMHFYLAYPVHVYCVCLSRGGKWSGEWQISIERLERAQVLGGADSRHCRWAPSLITVVYQT